MQFHHHGYVSGDPRVEPAAGVGLNRPEELPDEVDVLIVGTGPAGMLTAAQLSQFPGITTRIIERRPGRLAIGQADGIQARSVETFQAFGFAERITAEAYRITEMAFWKPDPADPSKIHRAARAVDDPAGISEFPHLIVNQARVLDYFAEFMANSPARMKPDYGYEFVSLEVTNDAAYPVSVTLLHTAGPLEGQQRVVRAKYVVGADGARSKVRASIGCTMAGDQANHAWGVMDILAVTDFPDIRTKCAIQAESGSILLIPREGGHLFRMYVDLGEAGEDHAVRQTTIEQIIAKANEILHPYTLDVRNVAWHSVYEVGHRLTDRFDDVLPEDRGTRTPRVFITGDACHTHSAKAGQGMNVSMQDGFNIGWKLGHVLEGRSPESLLTTYSEERQVVAKNLIDFDKQWSSMMAKKPEEFDDPTELENFYTSTAEFPAGFMTQYTPSLVVGEATHQDLAPGFTVGKRFKSAPVLRVCDTNPMHLGHHARADGRWRIYVFADAPAPGTDTGAPSLVDGFAEWLANAPESPLAATPSGLDRDAWFDVKVIYQQDHTGIDINAVPAVFKPEVGPFRLRYLEKVFGADPAQDIFEMRGLSRDGVVVVVRPDQYVANVLPLSATAELASFFEPLLRAGKVSA
ncbi:FAD-binding monooxygenase [Pseudarthrobacter sp. J75]|uniref:FAD-binding monooxygenase n=1 Tax=unclassified Pseudarthrobacter TaxID=2647000 RepID=UPI002E809002|nr:MULTISPECIES: FAD-binding monooxygenase [unclassified Pseudarthrobacter]MEE2524117.1 FAD-binding monooxygenase [Pseudarthrobacter sp. J47]MEE2530396.1 FAD-binding monooxygenase [Pseudarthrobacter sp. J75]MEE2568832.1 FAD-binding monooxygenase [Pseudarthrobacter sp. J64]